jgi:endonuclease/exonuclease/phosphatase (EEP) superfamily protein YafD
MRVGTWNVQYAAGSDKNKARLNILTTRPADIWVLTETHDDLSLASSHESVHSLQRPTGRKNGRWATIWSRFPIRERLRVCDEERTVAAVIGSPHGDLIVFGTVLPWHSDHGKHPVDEKVRSWSEQYRVITEQCAEWDTLRRDHPGMALCVAGDLNMNLGGPHYYGTVFGRSEIHKAMEHNGLVCTTEYDQISEENRLTYSPIDHVLVSKTLAVNSRVVEAWEGRQPDGTRLSDHSGLVVELRPLQS